MTLIALKDLPNGIKAGESYEETPPIAAFLIGLGVAKAATPDPPRRRTYSRRDLQAED